MTLCLATYFHCRHLASWSALVCCSCTQQPGELFGKLKESKFTFMAETEPQVSNMGQQWMDACGSSHTAVCLPAGCSGFTNGLPYCDILASCPHQTNSYCSLQVSALGRRHLLHVSVYEIEQKNSDLCQNLQSLCSTKLKKTIRSCNLIINHICQLITSASTERCLHITQVIQNPSRSLFTFHAYLEVPTVNKKLL